MNAIRRLVGAVVVVGLGLSLWAFWFEPASLRTRDHDIVVEHWPQECDGIRIAILADLHVGSPFNGEDKLRRIVAETNGAHPDLVLLAGDYVIHGVIGGTFVDPEIIAQDLSELT